MSKINWWLVTASTSIVALIVILFLLPVRLSQLAISANGTAATRIFGSEFARL
jgi:hypothetical protein